MPIYEYRCQACGKEFEELVFSRDECPPCPSCASARTEKLLSCCRSQMSGEGGADPEHPQRKPQYRGRGSGFSPCSGCSGGNCSSC